MVIVVLCQCAFGQGRLLESLGKYFHSSSRGRSWIQPAPLDVVGVGFRVSEGVSGALNLIRWSKSKKQTRGFNNRASPGKQRFTQ